MKSNGKMIASALTVMLMLVSYTQCVLEYKPAPNKKPVSSTEQQSQSNTTTNNLPDPIIVEDNPDPGEDTTTSTNPVVLEQVQVGVKNFDQINETMASLTGVDPTSNAIKNTFQTLEVQLPTDNDVKSFLAANQVAVTKLAAEYCNSLLDSTALRSSIWTNYNFNSFNSTDKDFIIDRSLDHFWGAGIDAAGRSASRFELQSLLNDLSVGEDTTRSSSIIRITKGVCTAVLGSASTIML